MAVSSRVALLVLVFVAAMANAGCMTKKQSVAMRTGQGEAMPVIEIKPGYVERIALMDRYRLHDETRKHMMQRPRVWVEEVSPDELPPETPPSEEAEAEAEPEAQR